MSETLIDFFIRYKAAVQQYGPDSLEAKAVRATTRNSLCLEYAKALDCARRHLATKDDAGRIPPPGA